MHAACGWVCARWSSPLEDDGSDTKIISREHTVAISQSSLVVVTGGKGITVAPWPKMCDSTR